MLGCRREEGTQVWPGTRRGRCPGIFWLGHSVTDGVGQFRAAGDGGGEQSCSELRRNVTGKGGQPESRARGKDAALLGSSFSRKRVSEAVFLS